MLFTKFAEGLEAVIFISLHSGADPVSSKQISQYQDVLPRHLEPVLQVLVKDGILKGTKGPRGGYTLAREKRKLMVGEIFRALSKDPIKRIKNKNGECNCIRKNITSKINDEIAENISQYLNKTTIEDLCKKIEEDRKVEEKTDFNI